MGVKVNHSSDISNNLKDSQQELPSWKSEDGFQCWETTIPTVSITTALKHMGFETTSEVLQQIWEMEEYF